MIFLLPLISVSLWASVFVMIRYLKMDMILLTTSRLTVSALIFFFVLGAKQQLSFPNKNEVGKQWGLLLLSALTGFVSYNFLINYSLQYLPAGILATLVNTLPLISLFFGYFFFKEKITLLTIMGAIIAFLGVVGMTSIESIGDESGTFFSSSTTYLAIGSALASAFSLSIYFALQKKLMKIMTPTQACGFSLILAAIICQVLLPLLRPDNYGNLLISLMETKNIISVIYIGVGGGFFGFLLWNITLKRFSMSRVSNILFLVPLLSLFGEMIFLGRDFYYQELGFMFLILVGVFIATEKSIFNEMKNKF